MLRKIECFVQPFKLDELTAALVKAGIDGMSVSEVRGFGRQQGASDPEVQPGEIRFRDKLKLEIVVPEELVDSLIRIIQRTARTGGIGAGKLFVLQVEDAVRIRTQEAGRRAVT